MTTRSAANKYIAQVSSLPGKMQAQPIETQSITNHSQRSEIKEQRDKEGPLSGSANKKVDQSLYEPNEFDDKAELNIDVLHQSGMKGMLY